MSILSSINDKAIKEAMHDALRGEGIERTQDPFKLAKLFELATGNKVLLHSSANDVHEEHRRYKNFKINGIVLYYKEA